MPKLTENLFVEDLGFWFRLYQGNGRVSDAPCIKINDVDALMLMEFLVERQERIKQSILDSAMEKARRRAGAK